tara:strand:- start:384 stop:1202 length:819 start_codon:yes stop_codon:yes gene_type:complete
MFIVLCSILAVVVAMLAVATILRRKETSTSHNKVGILERRLALFKSVIANVGILIGCLLSFSIGGFFLYVGETGSWDPVTTFFAFQGMLIGTGLLCILVYPWCKRAKQEAKDNNLICTDPAGLSKNHTDPFEKKRSEKVWEEIKELKSSIHLVGSEDELAQVQIRLNYLYLQLGAVSKELDPPIHGDMDRINIEIADSTFPEWMTIELRRTGGYLDHLWTIGSGDVTFHVSEVEKLILALQSCNANREELDNHYTVTGAGCSDHGLVTAKWR